MLDDGEVRDEQFAFDRRRTLTIRHARIGLPRSSGRPLLRRRVLRRPRRRGIRPAGKHQERERNAADDAADPGCRERHSHAPVKDAGAFAPSAAIERFAPRTGDSGVGQEKKKSVGGVAIGGPRNGRQNLVWPLLQRSGRSAYCRRLRFFRDAGDSFLQLLARSAMQGDTLSFDDPIDRSFRRVRLSTEKLTTADLLKADSPQPTCNDPADR
jgi:hypothetical protein